MKYVYINLLGRSFAGKVKSDVVFPYFSLINTSDFSVKEEERYLYKKHRYQDNFVSHAGEVRVDEKPTFKTKISKLFKWISTFLFGLGALSATAVFVPQVSEFIDERLSTSYVEIFTKPTKTFGDNLVATGDKKPQAPYQPTFDASLSRESRLIIDEIGVDAKINESTESEVEEALRKGVWRVSEFGTPYARKQPTILASHRFGFLDWTNDFRRKNSFYNFPKLEEGDTVEIIWNKRRYVYEIYGFSEGEEITDYQADLILYTCKFLDSNIRLFTYARLLEL